VNRFLHCKLWHVRGRDRDLLVDASLGVASLCEAMHDQLDAPLLATDFPKDLPRAADRDR